MRERHLGSKYCWLTDQIDFKNVASSFIACVTPYTRITNFMSTRVGQLVKSCELKLNSCCPSYAFSVWMILEWKTFMPPCLLFFYSWGLNQSPVTQNPHVLQVNFVGKLLGPQGSTIKRLQEETGAKISVLGKGSMRDKNKVSGELALAALFKNGNPCLSPAAFHLLFRKRSYERAAKPNMLTWPWSCTCLLRSRHLYPKLICEWHTPWMRSRSSSFRYAPMMPNAVYLQSISHCCWAVGAMFVGAMWSRPIHGSSLPEWIPGWFGQRTRRTDGEGARRTTGPEVGTTLGLDIVFNVTEAAEAAWAEWNGWFYFFFRYHFTTRLIYAGGGECHAEALEERCGAGLHVED